MATVRVASTRKRATGSTTESATIRNNIARGTLVRASSIFIALVTMASHSLLTMFSFFQSVSEDNIANKFWAVSVYVPLCIGALTYAALVGFDRRSVARLLLFLNSVAIALWLMVFTSSF